MLLFIFLCCCLLVCGLGFWDGLVDVVFCVFVVGLFCYVGGGGCEF